MRRGNTTHFALTVLMVVREQGAYEPIVCQYQWMETSAPSRASFLDYLEAINNLETAHTFLNTVINPGVIYSEKFWSQLVHIHKSPLWAYLLNSRFNDVIMVTWNQPCGSIYTTEISKCYKLRHFFPREPVVKPVVVSAILATLQEGASILLLKTSGGDQEASVE